MYEIETNFTSKPSHTKPIYVQHERKLIRVQDYTPACHTENVFIQKSFAQRPFQTIPKCS